MRLWREEWAPPWVVAWRLVWFAPAHLFRLLFVACLAVGWGRGREYWEKTR